ncbi:MurR/RpiR family transcriptional regulator [Macrococcus sp. EM39E]|uniref:MurR/RpiR family transcriptional regulator n=1 Tax=Macrococcus animalis TaxID=3395467 RepID=UPI0039BDB66E
MNFKDRVILHEDTLNDTDDLIVEYIFNNINVVCHESINKVAEALFLSPNTLVRFSKKIGYDGYSHLKNDLKQLNEVELNSNSLINDILKTQEFLNELSYEKILKIIHSSRNIVIFGLGDNIEVGKLFAKKLRLLNKHAEFYSQRHEMIFRTKHINSKDLIILLSKSGESKTVLEIANIAKENNIKIVSITNMEMNTLSKTCEYRIFYMVNNNSALPLLLAIETISNAYEEYIAKV